MTRFVRVTVVLAGAVAAVSAWGQAPAGATGQCKDNSYTTAAKKWQACAGHKGVQSWFADAKPAGTPAAAAAPAVAASQAAPATAATQTTQAKTAGAAASAGKTAPAAAAARTSAAPGGGPGLVWVNTATNVYHCPGGTFYGKTKEGKYMSEADAKTAGARPDRNKVCSK